MFERKWSTNPQPKELKKFRLNRIIVNAATNELIFPNKVIPIEDKVMKVLVYLAKNNHRIVSREELFNNLWSDVYVSQDSLNRCISIIRKVVGDKNGTQKVIQTVRNRGYRIVCSVEGLRSPSYPKKPILENVFEKLTYVASGIIITAAALLLIIVFNCFV